MEMHNVYNVKQGDIIVETMVAAKHKGSAITNYNKADIMLFVTTS